MATRGRAAPRECPVETRSGPCKARVAPARIMCAAHWRKVPAETRMAYLVAWGRFNETDDMDEWEKVRVARAAALAAAGGHR